jgi:hypothetical protein
MQSSAAAEPIEMRGVIDAPDCALALPGLSFVYESAVMAPEADTVDPPDMSVSDTFVGVVVACLRFTHASIDAVPFRVAVTVVST